jgi:competence protein ComEA
MSSSCGSVVLEERGDHRLSWNRAPWIWPVGARGVLAGVACAAAFWLAMAGGEADRSSGVQTMAVPTLRIDANTAPPQVLGALPHVGPALVRRLVLAREHRRLASLEDAGRRVRGLGPSTRGLLAPHLVFEMAQHE